MFLDASAMIAILASEDDAASLAARLDQAAEVHTSAMALYETIVGLARIANATLDDTSALVDAFLAETNATVVPIDRATGQEALAAFFRYGKGRHAAALNMGDCFAYACTRLLGTTLLCKGNDFPRTDIALA
ncbi:MAG TPA: type II toxin-antitoxin system VapC family toxin [Acetobacteraceae bacterium]|nr:type II toxin-antitoxin system VapC family toxin [Acetobacteraceae bacterium]